MTEDLATCIRKAAEVLKSFGAKEVYLFGSAATGTMDEHSDIDLAVTGLPPGVFFRAYSMATAEIPGREVDLVDLDQDSPFTQYLREEDELRREGDAAASLVGDCGVAHDAFSERHPVTLQQSLVGG